MTPRLPLTMVSLLLAVAVGLAFAPVAKARRARVVRGDALDPLYKRIAKDLKAGKPLVITVHVALCSNKSIWCGSAKLGNGDQPRTNLYWGGASGFTAWFRYGRRSYKQVFRDRGDGKVILDRVVYRRRVKWISKRRKRTRLTR